MNENIILMGMKHCGKSSLGRILAKDLSYQFNDLDDLIIKEYKKPVSSVREIYQNHGKKYFQEMEILASASAAFIMESNNNYILALGGGTIENSEAMLNIKKSGLFIYIQVNPETLFKRIEQGGIPPFLSKENPYEDFLTLYNKRCKLYEEKADLIIKLKNESLEESADILKNKFLEANNAR